MAQKLRDDKIGTLQHSAGNIQMLASLSNPAYLTIGGQQYKITSTLVVALPAMTANTRYQVFAVQSGGVVSLVISQNENSVGPAGYTRWKLVGSLYANGAASPAFGSFVNLKGAPETQWKDFLGVISASPTPPTFGTLSSRQFKWRRVGDTVEMQWDSVYTTAGTAGSGNYIHSIPQNLSIDTAKMGTSGNFVNMSCGVFSINTGLLATSIGYMIAVSTGGLGAVTYNGNILSGTQGQYSANSHNFSFQAKFPVVGFTNTPIEDL